MIYVYTDCDNAVACRDRSVLETYFRNALEDPTFSGAKIEELPDDANFWGDIPIMNIDTWMIDNPAGVLILVQSLSDLALLD